jgi:hypothetical protein
MKALRNILMNRSFILFPKFFRAAVNHGYLISEYGGTTVYDHVKSENGLVEAETRSAKRVYSLETSRTKRNGTNHIVI